jgi:glutamate/tyrosine decarboxylase-like PLP-dependent enzyme
MTPEDVHDELQNAMRELRLELRELRVDIREQLQRLEAKVNNQRILIIVAIIGVAAQIVNAWILRLK